MGADRKTKKKLFASAKTEFMEKGYSNASLRKICANAGVTTGALYFFFKDKEDLFRTIVENPLHDLLDMLNTYFLKDTQLFLYRTAMPIQTEIMKNWCLLIRHLYANRDAFLLLLTKSQGTAFENCIDEVVEKIEKGYRVMAERMAEKNARNAGKFLYAVLDDAYAY